MRLLFAILLLTAAFTGCLGGDDAPAVPKGNGTEGPDDAQDDAGGTSQDDPADNGTAPPGEETNGTSPGDEGDGNQTAEDEDELEDPRTLFSMDGTSCRELLVIFPIPIEQARAFVPENYTLLTEDAGQAEAFAGLKECDLTLDGAEAGRGSTSDVGVFIEAPDGSDGMHYYQTWWHTDHPELATRLITQGWRTAFTPTDAFVDERTQGVAGAVNFTVPWAEGSYGGTGEVLSAQAPGDVHAIGWHEGPHGTVVVDKVLTSSVQSGGAGEITAADGSPMVELIGGSSVQGTALYNEYRMTGTVGAP